MEIIIIAALGKKKQLGLKGKIPWFIKEDLQQFKKRTLGHTVLMGRKTYESIGAPLQKRQNIIISSNMPDQEGLTIFQNLTQAISHIKQQGEKKLFICGGAQIYKEALTLANQMYLSFVDYNGEADVFFPDFDHNKWQEILRTKKEKTSQHPTWEFVAYNRKNLF